MSSSERENVTLDLDPQINESYYISLVSIFDILGRRGRDILNGFQGSVRQFRYRHHFYTAQPIIGPLGSGEGTCVSSVQIRTSNIILKVCTPYNKSTIAGTWTCDLATGVLSTLLNSKGLCWITGATFNLAHAASGFLTMR